jgi:hypothetical protein
MVLFLYSVSPPSLKSKIMTYAVILDRTRGDTEATLTTCVINQRTSVYFKILAKKIIKKTPSVKTKDRHVSAEMGNRKIVHIKIH